MMRGMKIRRAAGRDVRQSLKPVMLMRMKRVIDDVRAVIGLSRGAVIAPRRMTNALVVMRLWSVRSGVNVRQNVTRQSGRGAASVRARGVRPVRVSTMIGA